MRVLQRLYGNLAAGLRALIRPARISPQRRTPLWPVKGWIVFAAAATLLIIVGSMLLVDVSLITYARGLPAWLRQTFEWITLFGTAGWFLWPAGILLLVIAASPWSKLTRFSQGVLAAISVRLGFIFFAIAVPVLAVAIIKRLIGRARPSVWDVTDPYSYEPLIFAPDYTSMPSGHTTNAFAVAIAIGAVFPMARLPMWIFALVIAGSRVIVDAHFPSDVVAGAVVGTAGALLVRSWFAARRFGFTVGSDGVIHRLPGPSWRRVKDIAGRLVGP